MLAYEGLASLPMFDILMITDARIRFSDTSPACVLEFGRVWMQELSTNLLSSTFLDFHRSLAAEKSGSCPG